MEASTALANVTIVVPVGPGDAMSLQLRNQLAALPSQIREVHPRIGARPTGTAAVAYRAGADRTLPHWQLIDAPRGRAHQQNAGARNAESDWLWFLHADCVLTTDTLPALARFIGRVGTPGAMEAGYFDLRFLDDGPALMRLNTWGVWLRSHCLGLPFGDQGLVLPRAVFERLGGFNPALEHGEDHDLVWRLRRAGVRLRPVGAALLTSARKYAERGWWPTTRWHLGETWRQARRFSQSGSAR